MTAREEQSPVPYYNDYDRNVTDPNPILIIIRSLFSLFSRD